MLKWLGLAVLVTVLDLWSKSIASSYLVLYQQVPVFPGFNWTLAHNPGAAFSFLSKEPGWQRWFFSAIALVVSIGITIWMKRLASTQVMLAAALALILGGAMGNLWDRMTLGYVVDFIDVYYGQSHWPAFNLADSAIFLGAVLLVLDSFRGGHDDDSESDVKASSVKKNKNGA